MEKIDNDNSNETINPSPSSRGLKEKIRICPACKQEVIVRPGMHNFKNLFRKPTFDEMITLFIILGVIGIYFMYQHDVKQYQNYIEKNCKAEPGLLAANPSLINETTLNLTNASITYANQINESNETRV